MRLDAIPTGKNPPHEVNVLIEVPIGGEPVKYEMNKEAGALFVDRMLYTSMRYPGNYGFIPHTLSGDGDPVDVIIANQRPLLAGCYIAVRPVGVLIMQDEAGQDEKIVAVPADRITAKFREIHNYTDLPGLICQQIQHFFEHYKDLEQGKWVKVLRWGDADEAKAMIVEGMANAERAKAGLADPHSQ